MKDDQAEDASHFSYDEYIIESFEHYLLACQEKYGRDSLISSKHLLYWIVRKMRKKGVEELDLINYIKECSNEFTEEKIIDQKSKIESNIDKINNSGKL